MMMPPRKPTNDQVLVCPICGRFAVVDFAVAIASGWPRCCEVSMLLAGAGALEMAMNDSEVQIIKLEAHTLSVSCRGADIVLRIYAGSVEIELAIEPEKAKYLAASIFTLAEGLERVCSQEKN